MKIQSSRPKVDYLAFIKSLLYQLMMRLQSALICLMLICLLQLLIVDYLFRKNKNEEQIGLKSLLKVMKHQNHLLHKQLASQTKARFKDKWPESGGLISDASSIEMHRVLEENNRGCFDIHIAIVCAGTTAVRTVQPLLKSLLVYRRRNLIHLHLVVDKISHAIFNRLLSTWAIPSLNYSFYGIEKLAQMVDWIPNQHYSGIYGLMKLVLMHALPSNLDKVIILDTDISCNTDIAELWRLFENFNKRQVIGLIDNQSNWYLRQDRWPALGRGFNTGVVLLNLIGLRNIHWNNLWVNVTKKILQRMNKTHLADQDVINAVINEHPYIVYRISCEWNVQLNENALSEWCYLKENSVPKIVHWNSPQKDQVNYKGTETFRKTYIAYAEYDGDLLKKEIFGCQQPKRDKKKLQAHRDECSAMREAGNAIYRTHIFFLEFDHFQSKNVKDVTLVTQLSVDRILMLESIAYQWQGPISVAIYASDAEAITVTNFVKVSTALSRRRNIGYHIVYKQSNDQVMYPVNYLRNVAKDNAQTDFILLSDVDFTPKLKLREYLLQVIYGEYNSTVDSKVAFVIPAFETTLHRFFMPLFKKRLLAYWDKNIVAPFRLGMWKAGQNAVNYTRWRDATEPYEVGWTSYFEPFIVVSKFTPSFDTRFVGFGWNKVSYTITLHNQGYRFIVLPGAYIVHLPHSPSLSNNRFRQDYRYRRCMNRLKQEFLKGINPRYSNGDIEVYL